MSAALRAMHSVWASSPPWKAMNPKRDRNRTFSSTSARRKRSPNVGIIRSSPPQRMVLWHLDHGDAHTVGIGDPRLPQPPWFGLWWPHDGHTRPLQIIERGIDVTDLYPQLDVRTGRLSRAS